MTNIIDIGFASIGWFGIIGFLLMLWVFLPAARRSLRYIYMTQTHTNDYLRSYWGENE